MKIAIIIAVLLIVFLIIENTRISVTRYRVTCRSLPKEFRGFRILHLSDLHTKRFGKDYERLISKIKPLHPDIIFFTGDLISRHEKKTARKVLLMKRLMKIAPVYYSLGNHEVDNKEVTRSLCEELIACGVHVLVNSKEILERENQKIEIYGLALESYFYKNPDGSFKNLPPVTRAEITELCGKNDDVLFSILLAHSPLPFDEYEKWGADLVFSGHMHGGVIRIPISHKGVLSPERVFFPDFTEGVFRKFGANMVVSRGLGKLRIFNPSEIVLVSLK